MIVIRRDLYASNGQWMHATRNGATYLGDNLLDALIIAHRDYPKEAIYLDDRDWSNDLPGRHAQQHWSTRVEGELKRVEFVNE